MSLKFYLFLLLVISVTSYNTDDDLSDHSDNAVKSRTKRGAFWDFFQKIVETRNLAFDQYNDTKVTLNEIYDLVSDGFSDGKPTKRPRTTTTTTPSPDSPMDDGDNSTLAPSTTTEKYRISRYELGRIAGRNLRGLKRLFRIELNDALNQSQYNIAGYQREAKMVFSNSIVAEKKAALKGIPTTIMATNATATNATVTNSTRT